MQVILTHENADFDAIASLLAAHKLYPGAKAVLPRRVNRNVQAFLSLYGAGFSFVRPNDLPRGQHVKRVILVDTQKLTFVRGMGKDIGQVTVIDHHAPPASVPEGWSVRSEPLGATTTSLVEAISTRLIPVSPAEATLMLVGIYEDTGSLTYAATTPRDLRAAAWLIDQGADLQVAAEFLDHPLTQGQQAIFDSLKENAATLELDGHPIVLSWAISPPDVEEEISTLAHKLRDLLEPSALFILVQIGANTQLVARSSTDDINVASVAEHFGGGGHSHAAASLIRGRGSEELVAELRQGLAQHVRPRTKVQDAMSYGVRTLSPDDEIREVAKQMVRTGHEGFPVLGSDQTLLGLVTRNAVDRALQHGLERAPVSRILQPGSATVSPHDSIERVRDLMIQTGWGQIPVALDGHIIGVVTRTDLIRLQPSSQTSERQRIAHLLAASMPVPLLSLIRRIGARAAEAGYTIYFVGGLVRDLLLGHAIVDVDIVVEGDAIHLGRAMADALGGEIRSHKRFGTAKWLLPDGIWEAGHADHGRPPGPVYHSGDELPVGLPQFIDLVTARTEFYEHPTALPMVSRSSIKQDLHRRDFTINTLAIRLDPQRWGELLDFYGGRADLEAGVIRVLHSLSFVDDPTRILRAARFETRLGFSIDERSEALIAQAIPLLSRVTGERIRHELDLIFEEAAPQAALARLQEMGALEGIHPDLVSDAWLAERLRRLSESFEQEIWDVTGDLNAFYWALVVYRVDAGALARIRARLVLSSQCMDLLASREAVQAAVGQCLTLEGTGAITAQLDEQNLGGLALAWLVSESTDERTLVGTYAREWRNISPELNGDDLKALGYRPGPVFREILSTLKAAKLDGLIATRVDEIALVETTYRRAASD